MRNLSTLYPGKVTVDANNPDGTFKNEVTPGVSNDGTPLEEQWQQDIWGWIAHLLNKVTVAPNGAQENEATSQIYDALETAARTLWTASLTQKGTVEQATSAEAIAGTSDVVFPSVLGLRQAFNAANAPPVYANRAWANFDGTGASPIAPNASGNISSITTAATGTFSVTFTTNMPDVNYGIAIQFDPTNIGLLGPITSKTVSGFTFTTYNWNGLAAGNANLFDPPDVNIVIYR